MHRAAQFACDDFQIPDGIAIRDESVIVLVAKQNRKVVS